MGLPTSLDLQQYLYAAGVIASTPTALQSALDLPAAIGAAIDEWEHDTGYHPFVAGDSDETRKFDALGDYVLDLEDGLVSLTSLTINGTVPLTLDTNFWLGPKNADKRKHPWTYVEFFWIPPVYANYRRSIAITGKWGYCTSANLPRDVTQALMARASMFLAPSIQSQVSSGLVRLTMSNDTYQYSEKPLQFLSDGWQGIYSRALARYARATAV